MSVVKLSERKPDAPLWYTESFTNATKGYNYGESGMLESDHTRPGPLYKALQAEYGRCISKVYRGTKNGTIAVGWVFQSRQRYDDARRNERGHYSPDSYYTREVWVTVYDRKPETESFPVAL